MPPILDDFDDKIRSLAPPRLSQTIAPADILSKRKCLVLSRSYEQPAQPLTLTLPLPLMSTIRAIDYVLARSLLGSIRTRLGVLVFMIPLLWFKPPPPKSWVGGGSFNGSKCTASLAPVPKSKSLVGPSV